MTMKERAEEIIARATSLLDALEENNVEVANDQLLDLESEVDAFRAHWERDFIPSNQGA